MNRRYRIFDAILGSAFPLPELPEELPDQESPTFEVRLGADHEANPGDFKRVFEWTDSQGRVVCWSGRRGDEFLFTVPRMARFMVRDLREIICVPDEDCDMSLLRHLLLNQVVPRVLGMRGRLILHASAVTPVHSDRTVAFLGPSGSGKSTLASSFLRHGARLVSDDSVLLEPMQDGVRAISGPPGIRLFADSMDAVFDEIEGFRRFNPYTEKQQMLLREQLAAGDFSAQALSTVFILDQPTPDARPDCVAVEPVTGIPVMMSLLACVFTLDPSDRAAMAVSFEVVGRAVSRRVRFLRLRYPRDHKLLARVREVVSSAMRPQK